ncbi:MAG TPA: prolyl oligopeptidase family serine peptidase, partial [Steroidobacteraceae bacterium]|nr:prolyl oligopeptidase family serine peptidase [Steroidobacteraceae bacterium]
MRAHVRTVIALIGLASSSAQAEERPSADVFGRIPQVQNVALTPDGKTVAWEDNRASEPVVVVLDLGATELRHSLSIDPGMKLRRLSWADDSTLLMDVSVTRAAEGELRFADEFFRTLAVDVTTGQVRTLLMNGSDRDIVTGASLLAARTAKPHTVTMATWDFLLTQERPTLGTRLSGKRRDSGWINTVFSVDTRTGEADAIEFGSQFTEDWAVDETGRPVARSEWEPSQGLFMILARAGLGWRLIHRQKDGGRLALVGLAADGRAILALGANGTARSKLWAIPLDGTGAKVLIEDAVRDVEAIIADTFTGAPLGVLLGGLRQETRWLDAKAESRAKSLARAFPQLDVRVTGRSASGERLLVHVEGPSRPPTYYLVDFGARKADIVGEAYPALANVPLGEVRAFTYRARDGAEIPAYLTLPPGTADRGLPLVVLPHGGPESRDDFAFNWKVQFLATRGYAVLQPQFRGSTGFGEAHRRAGYRQWGGLMQDDVTDGVRAMVAQGIADARRVCIVGASYGGYEALAGA